MPLIEMFTMIHGCTRTKRQACRAGLQVPPVWEPEGGSLDQCLYWDFCRKSKQDRVTVLGLACLNNFTGLWAIEVVLQGLTPGPRVTEAEEYCFLGCTGWTEVVGLWVSCLHVGGMLPGESFAICKKWLPSGGRDSLPMKPERFLKISKQL